jgi:hypothetical protein
MTPPPLLTLIRDAGDEKLLADTLPFLWISIMPWMTDTSLLTVWSVYRDTEDGDVEDEPTGEEESVEDEPPAEEMVDEEEGTASFVSCAYSASETVFFTRDKKPSANAFMTACFEPPVDEATSSVTCPPSSPSSCSPSRKESSSLSGLQ